MIKVGIIGGTGYTGVELLRPLAEHAEVELVVITSRSAAGRWVADVFPDLRGHMDLCFTGPEDPPGSTTSREILGHYALESQLSRSTWQL